MLTVCYSNSTGVSNASESGAQIPTKTLRPSPAEWPEFGHAATTGQSPTPGAGIGLAKKQENYAELAVTGCRGSPCRYRQYARGKGRTATSGGSAAAADLTFFAIAAGDSAETAQAARETTNCSIASAAASASAIEPLAERARSIIGVADPVRRQQHIPDHALDPIGAVSN
jgi:hypothetical protein